MEIFETFQDGTAVLTLSGRFEFVNRKAFQAAIKEAQRHQAHTIIVDVQDLHFVDSTAIIILKFTHDLLTQHGVTLILAGASPDVMGQLQNIAMTNVIQTAPSVEKALATYESNYGEAKISVSVS